MTEDTIFEAYVLFISLTFAGLLLLSMAAGISPADDWHTGLVLASCGLSIGCIVHWMIKHG